MGREPRSSPERAAGDHRSQGRDAAPHPDRQRARPGHVWIVAEYGSSAAYVRNIEANPRVRVTVGLSWRTQTVHVVPDDDPGAGQRHIGRRCNATVVPLMGTDLLTVRMGLDPAPAITVTI